MFECVARLDNKFYVQKEKERKKIHCCISACVSASILKNVRACNAQNKFSSKK
jgi:hypothetical protein